MSKQQHGLHYYDDDTIRYDVVFWRCAQKLTTSQLNVAQGTIRYDTRCYFNVRSEADISQLNLPHGTDN